MPDDLGDEEERGANIRNAGLVGARFVAGRLGVRSWFKREGQRVR